MPRTQQEQENQTGPESSDLELQPPTPTEPTPDKPEDVASPPAKKPDEKEVTVVTRIKAVPPKAKEEAARTARERGLAWVSIVLQGAVKGSFIVEDKGGNRWKIYV